MWNIPRAIFKCTYNMLHVCLPPPLPQPTPPQPPPPQRETLQYPSIVDMLDYVYGNNTYCRDVVLHTRMTYPDVVVIIIPISSA